MWGLRRQVSLLLDHGHPDAWSYPVAMVLQEADFVVSRINAQTATEAILLQMAVSTVPNMSVKPTATRKITGLFSQQIKALLGG